MKLLGGSEPLTLTFPCIFAAVHSQSYVLQLNLGATLVNWSEFIAF